MDAKLNGGPAFPTLAVLGDKALSDGGLTVRDYFAAAAMQGICASGPMIADDAIALEAYAIADAMVAARASSAQPEQPAQDTDHDPGPKPGDLLAWGSQAVLDVATERRRQIEAEGWTPEHDDEHGAHELAEAAACYCMSSAGKPFDHFETMWPWERWWFKASGPRRDLVKAAALILAEIERLDRAAGAPSESCGACGDGWIEWRGGECPAGQDANVEVVLRSGRVVAGLAARFFWDRRDTPGDIVRYRVVREAKP